jgi:hypothetical protein
MIKETADPKMGQRFISGDARLVSNRTTEMV